MKILSKTLEVVLAAVRGFFLNPFLLKLSKRGALAISPDHPLWGPEGERDVGALVEALEEIADSIDVGPEWVQVILKAAVDSAKTFVNYFAACTEMTPATASGKPEQAPKVSAKQEDVFRATIEKELEEVKKDIKDAKTSKELDLKREKLLTWLWFLEEGQKFLEEQPKPGSCPTPAPTDGLSPEAKRLREEHHRIYWEDVRKRVLGWIDSAYQTMSKAAVAATPVVGMTADLLGRTSLAHHGTGGGPFGFITSILKAGAPKNRAAQLEPLIKKLEAKRSITP